MLERFLQLESWSSRTVPGQHRHVVFFFFQSFKLKIEDKWKLPLPRCRALCEDFLHSLLIIITYRFVKNLFVIHSQVFSLPNLKPLGKYKITAHEGARIKKVHWARFKVDVAPASPAKAGGEQQQPAAPQHHEEACLMCLSNLGDVSVISVPDLRRQLHAECIRKEDIKSVTRSSFESWNYEY